MTQNTSSAVMQQRRQPADSLDDFPTPPWATRAFCEKLRDAGEPIEAQSVWEPACNRGYMAKPLAEYAGDVFATDVHSYGWSGQQDVADFTLQTARPLFTPDWVITNPPFRLAEAFIQTGMQIARRGVAVFVRTSFVEGVGRYQTLFRHVNEALFMPFAERVVLWNGVLLDPDVPITRWNAKRKEFVTEKPTSATSYCWLVFDKAHRGRGYVDRIPPCRKQLTRPGDYPLLPVELRSRAV